jgi:hypothetical protein
MRSSILIARVYCLIVHWGVVFMFSLSVLGLEAQSPEDCVFPYGATADEALVKVWLTRKPNLSEAVEQRIRQKRLGSRHGSGSENIIWDATVEWLEDRLGKQVLCEQVAGSFPHFHFETDSTFVFQFQLYEEPMDLRSDFISFQMPFRKIDGHWVLDPPLNVPDCKRYPERCRYSINRNEAKAIAAEHGLEGRLQVVQSRERRPDLYEIWQLGAAGECRDSVWTLDRVSGAMTFAKIQRQIGCVTYKELITGSSVIVEAQNMGDKQCFETGKGHIVTKHSYRVLRVFKGDSVPNFIEVVQMGGQLQGKATHISHGTVSMLGHRESGLLFLTPFAGLLLGDTVSVEKYFRYAAYDPYRTQLSYGQANRYITEERVRHPEKLLWAPIEQETGRERAWRQPGHLLSEALEGQLKELGYGYAIGKPAVHVSLHAYEREPWMALHLKASPVPLYLGDLSLRIAYDTSVFGQQPVADSLVYLAADLPEYGFSLPTGINVNYTDVRPGVLEVQLQHKSLGKAPPKFVLQPNKKIGLSIVLGVKLPEQQLQTLAFKALPPAEQPGGRYYDFADQAYKPLSYVLGVKEARFFPNTPWDVPETAALDTMQHDAEKKVWRAKLAHIPPDEAVEVWVPVVMTG